MRSDKARTNATWVSTDQTRRNHEAIFGKPLVLSEIRQKISSEEKITQREYDYLISLKEDNLASLAEVEGE